MTYILAILAGIAALAAWICLIIFASAAAIFIWSLPLVSIGIVIYFAINKQKDHENKYYEKNIHK